MSTTQVTLAGIIFVVTYLVIAFQKIPGLRLDRPGAALSGAVLMVLCGILSFEQAWQAIDGHTIVLLLGMMILNVYLEEAGFFQLAVSTVLTRVRTPLRLLFGLAAVSGGLSALFLNDTICLMMTPPLLVLLRQAQLPTRPYLLTLAMSANVGSVMTLTGNPQNMLVGIYSGISYTEFALRMIPVGVVGLTLMCGVLWLFYRRELAGHTLRLTENTPLSEHSSVTTNRPLLIRTLVALGCVTAGFIVTGELAGSAALGAVAMLACGGLSPRRVLERVDWVLLLFFAGLFIVVAGLQQTGLTEQGVTQLSPHLQGGLAKRIAWLSGISVVASNVVSNVPYVMVIRELVPGLEDPRTMWLVVAMASTFAGNLTIPGSVATLIVLERALPHEQFSFREFLVVGAVVTLVTVIAGGLMIGLFGLL